MIGDGSEREWLLRNLSAADIPGIHRGEDLARDYANMDVFTFPSRTDTFGNVVLEALASGVPAVVTDAGGPRFIVNDGVSGFVARTGAEFVERTALLLGDVALRSKMALAAREQACKESWDEVFRWVYQGYDVALANRSVSDVLFMPQYQEPLRMRIIENMCDILQDDPNHGMGWVRWSDRVFYLTDTGVVKSLNELWDGGFPGIVNQFS
ncbi:MAG: phosphatidylinositol alpha 1,6-mannosyltransferase [Bryobacterales bacterium]|nr:phosphatidylinositol alpha 1,6-mannosyltransferase [Bryobacterales bacterium]